MHGRHRYGRCRRHRHARRCHGHRCCSRGCDSGCGRGRGRARGICFPLATSAVHAHLATSNIAGPPFATNFFLKKNSCNVHDISEFASGDRPSRQDFAAFEANANDDCYHLKSHHLKMLIFEATESDERVFFYCK